MRVNSLAFRLLASSTAIAIVLLVSASLLLNAIFQQALERNFDLRLKAALDGILANVALSNEGQIKLQGPVADARFALPLSGWYWQVNGPGEGLRLLASPSLLDQQLEPVPEGTPRDSEGVASYSTRDSSGNLLRVMDERLRLFNQNTEYEFLVSGNFDELKAEVASFRQTLFFVMALLGLALLAAIFAQVRFSLRPLKDMQAQLNDIRGGKIELLPDHFPEEIQPVADELNLLVQSNFEIIDRSRMQVGNLAHALKTPISVLANESRNSNAPLAVKVREQLDAMRDHVNLYLDRARRAARAQAIGAVTEVEPVLQSLSRTLQRINADRGLQVTVETQAGLKFRGERQDLEEMVGNLMDNACKWAKSNVIVRASSLPRATDDARSWLTISVEDDGPGIPAEQRTEAMKRGRRLDETKPGSGLGMSIITETAGMYSGGLDLGAASIGGLRANLRLPALT
ncbi:MAG: sensor histidine kinase [Aestuariivirga sp.]